MIYSPKGRVLFAHVSRTGGLSITECLRRALPDAQGLSGQHDPLAAARPILGTDFDDAFKFSIVRNPWERFVSWYALIGQTRYGDTVDRSALVDPESDHWKDFDAFLESWSAEEFEVEGAVRRRLSQWAQLSDAEGTLLTDDIGRFESATEDLHRLFARIGLNCPPRPVINSSQHQHYSVYYSDFGRELVERVFREDVVGFGYCFERADGDAR
jgi:hypothetical protein